MEWGDMGVLGRSTNQFIDLTVQYSTSRDTNTSSLILLVSLDQLTMGTFC